MRRNIMVVVLAGVGLAAGLIVWNLSGSQAQPGPRAGKVEAEGPGNGAKDKVKAADPLPIKRVVLFNSGVGYFQREGEVAGNARVDLTFPVGDINDLLKSMILQDMGGGRISTVNYDSLDPIDKILRSFALDLNNNPSYGQILNQARGEKIEVLRQEKDKGAQPVKVSGTIIGMEVQRQPVGKDVVADVEMLNLSGDKGMQAIPLTQILAVRFLNPVLENEFQRALQVLAQSHDTQKKTVSLGFNGEKKRQVKVGYVVERPIWKTTYRLRMEPNGKVFLQGWALIENTSDDDWTDVKMTLVSGRPISYKMNLYEPLYIPRPTVEPELFASLRPPVYSGAMGPVQDAKVGGKDDQKQGQEKQPEQRLLAEQRQMAQQQLMNLNPGNWNMQGFQGGMPMMGGNPMMWGNFQGGFNGFQGFNGGFGFNGQPGNQTFNPNFKYQDNRNNDFNNFLLNTQQKLTFDELQNRRNLNKQNVENAKKALGAIAGLNFKEGIASVASAEEVGDYHQYVIDQKVSLARQKSAMLPILDQNIEGTKVSIYNESVQSKYPLLGLRLKNTAKQPLTQGPVAVFEGDSYAGDTRILDLQPDEERLLSYALDQSTEVKTEVKTSPSPTLNFKIGAASLTARYKLQQTKTYTIKNRSTHGRSVIIEHPIRSDWKLLDPQKPEKARDVYRFEVMVPANTSKDFTVTEEQARVDSFTLLIDKTHPPHYAVGLGIEVKENVFTFPEKLIGLKVQKGILYPTYKQRESKTYLVQNLSDQNRSFVVDHIIRADWALLEKEEVSKRGPDVYRFKLEVQAGKSSKHEVVEERVVKDRNLAFKELTDAKIKELVNNPAVSNDVKATLVKGQTLYAKLTESMQKWTDQKSQLKMLTDDQERLRKNLETIPQSSEPYKKFLQKFVDLETQIEEAQKQARQTNVVVLNLQKEYDAFIAAMTAV
jgi:hypothetical protein